ncbi:ATP-binding cassette domain-containing protein [Streptosporangium lutulentum]
MQATIEVAGLRKRFGRTVALDGMSFTVKPGQVTGFVGPNGAGKSTTMRVILGLDAADEGSALVGGRPYTGFRGRCAASGRSWTPRRCSRAAPPATTCCGWPTPRAWAPGGSTR